VSGKVTAGGKPVTGGTLVFTPVAGGEIPPASVTIGADGSYSSDKVPTGKNKLIYNAPPAEHPKDYKPKPSEPAPMSPFARMVPKTPEVDVKSGSSTLDVEIGYPGK